MIYHASREDVFDEFELIGRDVSQRDHHHHHRHHHHHANVRSQKLARQCPNFPKMAWAS